jgi:hypothetical protein
LQPRSVSSSPTTGVPPSSFPISNRPNSDSSAAQPPGISGTVYDQCPECTRVPSLIKLTAIPIPDQGQETFAQPDQNRSLSRPPVNRRAIPTQDQGQETFAQLDQWPGPRVSPIPRAIASIDHQSAGHFCLTVSAGMAITMEQRVLGNPITSAATTYSPTTSPSATLPASLEARSFPNGNALPSEVTLNPFSAVDPGERKQSTNPTSIWTVTNSQHFTRFSAAFPTSGIIPLKYVKKLPILQSLSLN